MIKIIYIGPSVSVHISGDNQATASQYYSIDCQVHGTDSLNSSINYQWCKDEVLINTTAGRENRYIFNSLKLSDVGSYSCKITVESPYLNSPISHEATFNLIITSE